MSKQCQCGGLITTGQLSDERTSWRCKSCGRYEVVDAPGVEEDDYTMPLELVMTNEAGEVVVDVALNPYTGSIESACLPLHPDRPVWKTEAEGQGWLIAHSTIPEMMEAMDAEPPPTRH